MVAEQGTILDNHVRDQISSMTEWLKCCPFARVVACLGVSYRLITVEWRWTNSGHATDRTCETVQLALYAQYDGQLAGNVAEVVQRESIMAVYIKDNAASLYTHSITDKTLLHIIHSENEVRYLQSLCLPGFRLVGS